MGSLTTLPAPHRPHRKPKDFPAIPKYEEERIHGRTVGAGKPVSPQWLDQPELSKVGRVGNSVVRLV